MALNDLSDRPQSMEEKMDVVIAHLENLDRRDRLRMMGGVLHAILTLLPLVFFVWSTWYLYAHFDEIMSQMMRQSAQSAANGTADRPHRRIESDRGDPEREVLEHVLSIHPAPF